MDRVDSAYNDQEYYLRYDPDEVDIIEEKKAHSSWPLLILVPLVAIAGISTLAAYNYSASSNGIRNDDPETIVGVGGGEFISPLPDTTTTEIRSTGPTGPSGVVRPISSPSETTIPRRSRYIP